MTISKYNVIEDIEIEDDIIDEWQNILNIIADLLNVPAALIMRVHNNTIEVFLKSENSENVYKKGEEANLNTGLYCETVMSKVDELLVPDALEDPLWDHNPDIELGMISYLGYPLVWPEGEIFGTICVLDKKKNNYSDKYKTILLQFRKTIQLYIEKVYEHNKLKRSYEKLQSLNDDLKQYSYYLAHDLKNPLSSIQSFIKYLDKKYSNTFNTITKSMSETIIKKTNSMVYTINKLLSYSITEDKSETFSNINMNKMMETVLNNLSSIISEKDADIVIDDLPNNIYGNKALIISLFQNLMSNSLKYSSGTPHINITSAEKDTVWEFKIIDNGIGIAPEDINKIFNIGYRGKSIKRNYPGTGLGLSFCKKVINLHNGKFSVHSEPGKGSTFIFTIERNSD